MTSSVTLAQMVEFKELPSSMHTQVPDYEWLSGCIGTMVDCSILFRWWQLTMELNRNVLKKCHLWAMLPWEVVIALMAELTPIVFPPNHDIVKQGEISPGLHFIEQGRVRVLKKEKAEAAEDQESKEVAVLGARNMRETEPSCDHASAFEVMDAIVCIECNRRRAVLWRVIATGNPAPIDRRPRDDQSCKRAMCCKIRRGRRWHGTSDGSDGTEQHLTDRS